MPKEEKPRARRFSKFYRRHFDLVSKYNVGLKALRLQGLSELEFYGDLVYKFRKIIDFSYHLKNNMDVLRHAFINTIKVNTFAYLFD